MQERREIAEVPARPAEMRWCKDARQAEVLLRRLRAAGAESQALRISLRKSTPLLSPGS